MSNQEHREQGQPANEEKRPEPSLGVKLLRTLEGHKHNVLSVAFDPQGGTLVSGSDDKTVKLWEAQTGKPLRILEGHQRQVWSVAFDAEGGTLASGSADNTVRFWEARSGKLLRTLEGHADWDRLRSHLEPLSVPAESSRRGRSARIAARARDEVGDAW